MGSDQHFGGAKTLAAVAPELVAEISAALAAAGRDDLVPQVASAVIDRYTYDPTVDAGHILFVRPRPSSYYEKLSYPVAETISLGLESGLNIDVDNDGHLFGIEFLGRADLLARLRQARAV